MDRNFLIHDGPDDPADKKRTFATVGCIEVCGVKKFDEFNDLLIRISEVQGVDRAAKLNKLGTSGCIKVVYEKAEKPMLKKVK